MACVRPMFILVNATCCFIYLYFFSGSFPRSPFFCTCPRSSYFCCYFLHSQCHCSCQLLLPLGLNVIVAASYYCPWESYVMVLDLCCHTQTRECARAAQTRRPLWAQLCPLPLTVYALSHLLHLPGLRGAPPVRTLTRCQDWLLAVPRMGVTPIVIMLDTYFPDCPVMERKASDY